MGKSAVGGAQVQLVEGVVLSGGKLEEARPAPRNTAGLIMQAGQLLFHIGAVACRPLPVGSQGERTEPTGSQLVRVQLRPERPPEYWGLSPSSVMDVFWQLLRDLEGGDLSDTQAQRAFEKFIETWFKFFNAGHTMESALDQTCREVGRAFKGVHNQHFVVVQTIEKRERAVDPKRPSTEHPVTKRAGSESLSFRSSSRRNLRPRRPHERPRCLQTSIAGGGTGPKPGARVGVASLSISSSAKVRADMLLPDALPLIGRAGQSCVHLGGRGGF